MSSNWKLIGRNSGNMSHHRNVASNKLNYETGKWDSIYDVSGKDVKGYTFDICGQNVVLGIGTTKPFSRLSLGTDVSSGIFDPNEMGQLAAIALDEENDGKKFTGILLNSNLTNSETLAQSTPIETTTGIQIMSSVKDFSLNDISNGQIYLTNNNVTTIGGIPRVGNEYNTTTTGLKCPGTYGDRKIVLDVRGSLRTDGYINFYDKVAGSTFSPDGTSYNDVDDIPVGSLFLTNGNGSNTGTEGLYFKNKNGIITLVSSTGGGGGGGTSDISAAFDVSLNGTYDYQYIVNKAKSNASASNSGGVPATFSGKIWPKSEYNTGAPSGFNNALTVRDGNLAVITPSGDDLKLINAPSSSLMTDELDGSGGIILAQRQLLIGSLKTTSSGTSPYQRYGYGRIDIQGIYKVPSLQCYNYINPATDSVYNPNKATNSIILITKNSSDNGTSSGGTIGITNDCSNTIIIGGRFSSIDTPNSIISNIENINSSTTAIRDISGSNIIFGHNNNLTDSCYTLIMGASNQVDNTNKGTNITGRNQNNVLGSSNKLFNSENSFVQGYSNKVFGNQNSVFGNSNSVGNTGSTNTTYKYFTKKSFIQGNNNQIISTYEQPVQNVFIAGKNNNLDMSYNSFTTNNNTSYTLLGTRADISGSSTADTSNVRFAFGTYEKWVANGATSADNGNILTIDCDGHVRIDGNLTVDGSFVKLDVIHKDVSDNNITLNSVGHPANGGGITILDNTNGHHGLTWYSTPTIYDSQNYWDTSGADLSTNNLFVNNIVSQDISANDASFNDLSLNYLYVHNDISANYGLFQGDISANDASFNDLSLNYLYVHNDISANDGFFQGDLSCNGKLTVGGVIDPTGLIFTVEGTPGQGLGTMTASEGGIYTDGDDLFFIPKGKSIADSGDIKKFAQIAPGGGSAGMTSFSLAGDTGSQTITQGNTVTIATGNGLESAAAATDTVTISLETKLAAISALTASNGNFIVGNGSTWVAESGSTARESLGVDPAGTDNSTAVTLANVTSNYLSLDGQEITAGTVPVSLGGTGVATVNKNLVFAGSATTNGQPPSFRALEPADIPDHSSGAGKIVIDNTATEVAVIQDDLGSPVTVLAAGSVTGSNYITITNGNNSPYIKSTSGLFIETTAGGDIALGNNANALKLTMPDNGSGAGETFTIEGQEAGGTSHAKGGNVKIIGGTGADTNGGGGDVEIVGGAKRAGGNGVVGNILLQGGYNSTGVTINPAGNISTDGTLTVDSTSTLTGNATFGGDIVADGDEAKNIFAAVTSKNITIGGSGSTTVVDGLTVTQGSTLTGNATFGGDIVADGDEAKNIFAAVTSKNITIGGSGSTTVVDGLTVTQGSTLTGNATFGGDIVADGDEAKNIFAAVTSKNITIGGSGSTTVVDTLSVTQASTLTGNATFGGDIVADANEAKNIFAAVTSNNITIGGTGSTTVVDGLTVNDNVGIGTSSPIHPLQIGDNNVNMSVQAASGMVINGTINNSFESDYPSRDVANDGNAPILIVAAGTNTSNNLSFGIGGSNYDYNTWIQGYYDNGSSGNGTKDILLQPDGGNVGIGETSPDSNVKLHIKSAHNDGCRLKIESSNSTSGWKAPVIDLVPAGGSSNLILANGPDGGITMRAVDGKNVILNDKNSAGTAFTTDANGSVSGRVGIGISAPLYPLHVAGVKNNTAGNNGRYFSDSVGLTTFTATTAQFNIGAYAEGYVRSGLGFVAFSDERIKENITEVPDNLALQKLRDISCCYYEYKDKIRRGTKQTIGFIAQQVKEHLPMAVDSDGKEIIPNEMRVLEATWDGVNMSSDLTDVSGVKYKFYVSNDPSGNDEVEKEIVGNEDNTFTFDKHYNNVFCYGKEVDDFHTVDKQKLFAVNFSATQEIDKIQQEEKTKLAAAEAKIATLEARLSALENQ